VQNGRHKLDASDRLSFAVLGSMGHGIVVGEILSPFLIQIIPDGGSIAALVLNIVATHNHRLHLTIGTFAMYGPARLESDVGVACNRLTRIRERIQ